MDAPVPQRAVPPADITPHDFFVRWVPESVASDPSRRERLGSTAAVLQFDLGGDGGGIFTLHIDAGRVLGSAGANGDAHLRVRLDVTTWRDLNAGVLTAPEAFLRRRVRLEGNLALAVKLHLILG